MALQLSTTLRSISATLLFFTAFNSYSQLPVPLVSPVVKPPFKLYQPAKRPFWRDKKKLQQRLQDGEIIVSVTTGERQESGKKLEQFHMKGVGWVRAPFKLVKQRIHRYDKLQALAPSQFREIKYDKLQNQIFVHGVALKWHARMHMQLYNQQVSHEVYRLHWKVFRGNFKGLKGYFELYQLPQDHERRNVEFSMTAFYESGKLPLPSFLLRFGLETVLRIVAKRMRKYLQSGIIDG